MKRMTILTLTILLLTTACRLARGPEPARPPITDSTPAPTLPSAPPAFASAEPVLNVRYSDETTQRENGLSLDVYPATGAANLPVLIFVHGGGWFRGDKSGVNVMPIAFNARGFVFVSINYRLLPEVNVTQQMQDVARAVAWTKKNIAQYGGDPARIFLMGHSAGAHLVALLGTDESYLRAERLSLADIKGIVALDTQTYDLHKLISNLPRGSGEVYTGTFGDDPEFWKKMSPLTHVESKKGIPPMLIAYTGEKETRVYFSRQFYEALQQAGVSSALLPAPEKTHGQIHREFGMPNDRVSKIVFAWLEELLRGQ